LLDSDDAALRLSDAVNASCPDAYRGLLRMIEIQRFPNDERISRLLLQKVTEPPILVCKVNVCGSP